MQPLKTAGCYQLGCHCNIKAVSWIAYTNTLLWWTLKWLIIHFWLPLAIEIPDTCSKFRCKNVWKHNIAHFATTVWGVSVQVKGSKIKKKILPLKATATNKTRAFAMKSEKHDRNKERTNKKNLDTQYGEKTPLKLSWCYVCNFALLQDIFYFLVCLVGAFVVHFTFSNLLLWSRYSRGILCIIIYIRLTLS